MFDKAVKEFQLQLKDEPESIKVLTNLGHCFAENNKFKEAADIFQKVLDLKPDQAVSYLNLAMSLKMDKRLEEAFEVLQKGIDVMSSAGYRNDAVKLKKYLELLQFQQFKQRKN